MTLMHPKKATTACRMAGTEGSSAAVPRSKRCGLGTQIVLPSVNIRVHRFAHAGTDEEENVLPRGEKEEVKEVDERRLHSGPEPSGRLEGKAGEGEENREDANERNEKLEKMTPEQLEESRERYSGRLKRTAFPLSTPHPFYRPCRF